MQQEQQLVATPLQRQKGKARARLSQRPLCGEQSHERLHVAPQAGVRVESISSVQRSRGGCVTRRQSWAGPRLGGEHLVRNKS